MAVAAYASLLSLAHVLDQIQHPVHRHRLRLDTEQLRTLQEKVKHLQEFLEDNHSKKKISQEVEDLARQIPVVAYEAEDVIDSHVVYVGTLPDRSDHDAAAMLSSFYQDLDKVIQEMDSIIKELMGVVKEEQDNVKEPKPVADSLPINASSSRVLSSGGEKSNMVGFDDRLVQIIDQLTRDDSDLKILPVVGMGGIGKTTLARNVFDHAYIVDRFDIRIWFTISQEYSAQEILLRLLNEEKKDSSENSLAELGKQLHQKLFRRRYLIVMDDVWSIKAWDDLKQFFPDNGNGSRVVVTTRLSNVAVLVGSHDPYSMDLLDEENCWNLLCEKVFAQGGCPNPELEQIGKDIAKGCKGLPLALVVIGGLLAKSNMTREYWESVAKNINSFANSEDNEHCLNVLSLTYNSLPIHLKPCFLYMRVFPEDKMIKVSELIGLWVAEGLIKPVRGKTLEEVAETYLNDLIDMNLIFILGRRTSGKIKSIGIHDLLRDLCTRESDRENIIRVPRVQQIYGIKEDRNKCNLCHNRAFSPNERINVSEIHVGLQSTALAISLVCEGCKSMYPDLIRLRWVKVFGRPGGKFMQHTKLRYISFGHKSLAIGYELDTISSSRLSLLWNLQTLSIKSNRIGPKIMLPSEIWIMPQLRHINITWVVLPDPVDAQDTTTILENLQTLSVIQNFRCTKEVVERIPNLKQLKVEYSNDLKEWSYYCLCNLAHLHKLESLNFMARDFFLESITFPTSLKKLTMSNCKIPWEGMTIIGSLPNLEVLKLYRDAFKGQEWNPVEGEFLRLKALFIESCELVHWTAEDTHFPNLEILSLRLMSVLKEIPSSIGDIVTLKSILVRGCCGLVADSASRILEEQRSNGNESLQFYGQTLVIEVNMHRDGSERKVKNAVSKLRGVIYVEVNRKQDRLTVTGDVDPIEVVKTVRKKAGAAYIVTLT